MNENDSIEILKKNLQEAENFVWSFLIPELSGALVQFSSNLKNFYDFLIKKNILNQDIFVQKYRDAGNKEIRLPELPEEDNLSQILIKQRLMEYGQEVEFLPMNFYEKISVWDYGDIERLRQLFVYVGWDKILFHQGNVIEGFISEKIRNLKQDSLIEGLLDNLIQFVATPYSVSKFYIDHLLVFHKYKYQVHMYEAVKESSEKASLHLQVAQTGQILYELQIKFSRENIPFHKNLINEIVTEENYFDNNKTRILEELEEVKKNYGEEKEASKPKKKKGEEDPFKENFIFFCNNLKKLYPLFRDAKKRLLENHNKVEKFERRNIFLYIISILLSSRKVYRVRIRNKTTGITGEYMVDGPDFFHKINRVSTRLKDYQDGVKIPKDEKTRRFFLREFKQLNQELSECYDLAFKLNWYFQNDKSMQKLSMISANLTLGQIKKILAKIYC